MDTVLTTGLLTLAGAALGFIGGLSQTLINTGAMAKSNSLMRQLELYKVIFPDKYQAAKSIMGKAYPIRNHAVRYLRIELPTAVDVREAVEAEIEAYNKEIVQHAWLLGENAAEAARSFWLSASYLVDSNKNLELNGQERSDIHKDLDAKYQNLSKAMTLEIDPRKSQSV